MSGLDQYELAQRLETLAEHIEDGPEWFVTLDLDDEGLIELLREAATMIRDEE